MENSLQAKIAELPGEPGVYLMKDASGQVIDALARCQPNDEGAGTTCWPAPESTANMNTKRMGRLGLSEAEEDAIVSFLQTLSDGFMPINRK